jgi:phosphoglycolate phosphatase
LSAKFKAVFFDLDGTLLDTVEDLALAVNAVLERNGFPVHPVENYHRYIGEGMSVTMRRALPEGRYADPVINGYTEAVREEYRRRWADHTRVYPGIAPLLDYLEEKGVVKAILSNKLHEFTVAVVERLLGRWNFAAVQGEQPPLPRKPDPTSALAMARKLGLKPAEIIFAGDSAVDIQVAIAAGMYPVGVLWGYRSEGELSAAGAKILAAQPSDLAELF